LPPAVLLVFRDFLMKRKESFTVWFGRRRKSHTVMPVNHFARNYFIAIKTFFQTCFKKNKIITERPDLIYRKIK